MDLGKDVNLALLFMAYSVKRACSYCSMRSAFSTFCFFKKNAFPPFLSAVVLLSDIVSWL